MRLNGLTAVVTGGTRGLGRAIVERYLDEGATVVAAARTAPDDRLRASDQGGRLLFHATDVTDPRAVSALFDMVRERFDGLDILVNNAGISRDGKLGDLPLAEWKETIDTNLTGTFLCTSAAVELMRDHGGRIINVSSCTASRPVAGAAAYCSSKAAIEVLTRCAALELAPMGIAVNCLAPGYIDAGMTKELAARHAKVWARYQSKMLAGRPGRPDELADAAVYLACPESSYVNGHVLEVNGGLL